MTELLLVTLLVLVWIGGGYICGNFIIRWNKKYLSTGVISPAKFNVAHKLNADLGLYRGTKVSVWKPLLTCMGPITIVKAAMLRVLGGKATISHTKEDF